MTARDLILPLVLLIIGLVVGYFIALPGKGVTTTVTTTVTVTSAPSPTVTTTPPVPAMRTPIDTLIIAMDTSDAVSLDPARAYEFTSCFVTNQLYDKLVDFELPDLINVKPEVAERWEYSPDGLVWTFYIRKGIKFASGNPLTADDVVYSLQRVIKLKQTAYSVIEPFLKVPEQIEKVDDYTVRIRLNKTVAPGFFLSVLTFTTSSIVDSKVVEAHAKEGDMGSGWLTDHSAGSGPFILEKWDRESQFVLRANPNYWKPGQPALKNIIIKHVPEPTDQLLLIQKGDADVVIDLTADQVKQVENQPEIKVVRVERFLNRYIGMNVAVKPLDKEEVRDAIRYCIDYDAIVNDILKGAAVKWQTVVPKGLLGANPKAPYYKNVTLAKQLLAKAGYPDGFEIELTTAPTYPAIDIATKIQADLAECGIRVKINQMTASMMYEKYRKQGLQLVLAQWGSDYPDPDSNAMAFGNHRIRQLAWRNSWYDDYAAELAEKASVEMDL
ncbi:MAG: ABC transporter substrate-binding protein, partial [Candidatus Korarchaeum sp.]|nr:ABC transporter substrate-binding protein [Candidatus Korarchaeum sp.]